MKVFCLFETTRYALSLLLNTWPNVGWSTQRMVNPDSVMGLNTCVCVLVGDNLSCPVCVRVCVCVLVCTL